MMFTDGEWIAKFERGSAVKTYTVRIELVGLTGVYYSDVEVQAGTMQSAVRKAEKTIGNRDGRAVSLVAPSGVFMLPLVRPKDRPSLVRNVDYVDRFGDES